MFNPIPRSGSWSDEGDTDEFDGLSDEDLDEAPPGRPSLDGFKQGEDMCYSILLQERRLRDSAAKGLQDLNPSFTKGKRKHKGPLPPAKRKKVRFEEDEAEESENDEDDDDLPREKSLVLSKRKSLGIRSSGISQELQLASNMHRERIQAMVDERARKREAEKRYIDDLAFTGLVGVGATVDQTFGYDGKFAEHLEQNEGIKRLLSATLEHECGDPQSLVKSYGKMGFFGILVLEFLKYRNINITACLPIEPPKPSVQAPTPNQPPQRAPVLEPGLRQSEQPVSRPPVIIQQTQVRAP